MTTITPTIRQVTRTERDKLYYLTFDALAPVAKGLEKEERAVKICGKLCWTIGDVVRVLEMAGESNPLPTRPINVSNPY